MASFVFECFFCLLPFLLVLLLSVAPRWPRVHYWTNRAVRAAGWRLWVIICWILELPPDRNTRPWTKEAGSLRTDFLMGSGRGSEGLTVICKPTALAKYLQRHCYPLFHLRLSSWPRGDPQLQTLSNMLYEKHADRLQFTRDHLLLRDGGVVALDWAVGTRLVEASGRRRKECQSTGKALGCFTAAPPVLLVVPQYWGGMTPHLKVLCHQAVQQGFYVVVFHARGMVGCPLTTTRLTEFGDPADLEQAVAYVHSRFPSSALVAVSEGSGSGTLLSYLGESGSSSYLTAAAAISPVLLGQRWFEMDMPPIYRWLVMFQQKMRLRRYQNSFSGVLDVDRALSTSSLRDFEEALFCSSPSTRRMDLVPPRRSESHPTQGLAPSVAWALGERAYPAKDWDSYWERNEPLRDADEVAVPVLCVCSHDDPLLPPASTLPLPLFQSNPYFLLALTDRGGHCGFTLEGRKEAEGSRAAALKVENENWSHIAVLEYFRVVADFLRWEARGEASWGTLPRENSQRSWTSKLAPLRRRRVTMMRRTRLLTPEQSRVDADEESFTWKRSYTR